MGNNGQSFTRISKTLQVVLNPCELNLYINFGAGVKILVIHEK